MILVTKTSDQTRQRGVCVCVCVCMFFFPIYSGLQACGRTSRGHTGGRSHRISHPPSFCGACLNFFSRQGFSCSFLTSTVKWNFVFLRCNRSLLVGFFFSFSFLRGKIPVTGIRTHVPKCQKVSRLPTEPPGRPACRESMSPLSRLSKGFRKMFH